MSERIAEITLNVNTTGYSRRKERCSMCVMPEQMFWSWAGGWGCTQNQSLEPGVRRLRGSVELREAEDRPLA